MPDTTAGFHTIDECLADVRAGRMIVLVDDEHRENEGDLVVAAEKVTPEAINFMMRKACGLVCLAMSPAISDRLHLDPGGEKSRESYRFDSRPLFVARLCSTRAPVSVRDDRAFPS